jgi:MoxR-like ATPase
MSSTIASMIRILHCALFTPTASGGMGLPVYFEGDSGVGKTTVLRNYARRLTKAAGRFPVEVLNPGGRGEAAFGVVPVPVDIDGQRFLTDPSPLWAHPFASLGFGVVFVDEMSTGTPLIQSSLLSVFTERYLAGATFAPGVRIIAAGNPVGQAANGHDLAAALARRCSRIAWPSPSTEEFGSFLSRAIGNPDPTQAPSEEPIDADAEEARVLAAWPSVSAQFIGTYRGWLASQPQYLNKPREDAEPTPSPRTHDLAIRAFIGAAIHGLTESETDTLAGGFIGPEALAAFRVYQNDLDLPDIASVLDGAPFDHDPRRADRTAAFVFGAESYLRPKPTTPEAIALRTKRAGRLFSLLESLPALSFDLVASAVMDLYRSGLSAVPGAERISARIYAFEQAMAKAGK